MAKKPTTGPRGRQGVTGPRGARGHRGERGIAGRSGAGPEVVRALTENFEQLRTDVAVQFQRIAQLQAQLDVALAELEHLKTQHKYDGADRRHRVRKPR